MQFKPLHNNVVLKKQEPNNKTPGGFTTPGGIVLLEETQKTIAPNEGIVLAVGPGKYNKNGIFMPCDVSVGDKVMFGQGAGTAVKIEDQDVLILKDEDILGIISSLTEPIPEAGEVAYIKLTD